MKSSQDQLAPDSMVSLQKEQSINSNLNGKSYRYTKKDLLEIAKCI